MTTAPVPPADLAASLADARVIDLSRPIEAATPHSPHHAPFQMALLRRHGDVVREAGLSGANELITMGAHTATHIDALSHISLNGRLHGSHDAAEAQRGGRFQVLGAETIKPLLGRGVLLDVAAHRGTGAEGLPPGYAITASDLQSTADAAGVRVESGDTVFVRTGWATTRYADTDRYIGWDTGVPGPDLSAARWLSARGVVATGTDTAAYEVLAPGAGHARLPVHGHLLAEAGVHLIEQAALDELAAHGGRIFALIAVPLRIVGATGSPLRPLALL
ncbi:cyclase family protein [Streptomyces sp. GbtcB6]|uniref:cyclase family protein n=1 Tax=Streptomyces sp. GbtcB6 TaxID=2824751 RepID=UPI001C30DD41|nr:cyclase family protein [Streptomyces sp. GbtcB6]